MVGGEVKKVGGVEKGEFGGGRGEKMEVIGGEKRGGGGMFEDGCGLGFN